MINTARSSAALPSTASSVSGTGDVAWTNPNNVFTDNGSSAFFGAFSGGQVSELLRITNFGFNIPSNAVIDGILLSIDIAFQFSEYASTVQLRTNSLTSSNKAAFGSLQASYGGSSDLWGMTLTPAIINGSDFGVEIACGDTSGGDAQASIDYVQLTIYWHYDTTIAAAEVPTRYDHKIYSPSGVYLGNLPNVVSEFNTKLDINSAGSQLSLDVAGDIDSSTPDFSLGALTQWLPGSWLYRNKITIARTNLSAELTEFPVYFDLSTMSSEFWANVKSDGSDIRMTNIYGSVELPFQLINFDQTNKTGHVWFKANLLSNSYDNIFYIYYGNSGASAYAATDTYGSQNVWSGYKAVYHLDETKNTTASGYKDSSPNLTHGTGVSMTDSEVTGKIYKAADFDGVDDQISISSAHGLGNNTVTLSQWVYVGNLSQNGAFIKVGSGANGFGVGLGGSTFEDNGSQLIMLFEAVRWITTGYFFPSTGWYKVDMVINASGVPSVYVNGVLVNSFSGTNAIAPTTSSVIGGYTNHWYNDPIDEVRIAAAVRNAAWIAAEYANQNSPTTFYSIGARELESIENNDVLLKNGNLINVYETSYYYPNGKLMYQGQINRIKAKFDPNVDGLIKVLCHSDGRDLDNMVARGAPFSYTNQVTQTSQNTRVSNISYLVGGWERQGQLFRTGAAQTNIGRIQVMLDGIATVTLRVFTNASLATQLGSVTKSVNVAGPTVVSFEFSDFIPVSSSTDYFFTLECGNNSSIWVQYSNANPYANGSMYTSSYAGGSGGGNYLVSSGNDLYFTVASGTPTTQATYSTQDPSTGMLIKIMDDYIARGGLISYNTADIQATSLSLTASFNTNTIYEAIQKVLDMSPASFYWFVDLGTNKLTFKETSRTPDFLFIKGRHIEELELDFSIENVVNDLLFSGGETAGVNLYSEYSDSNSKAMYGQRLNRKSDNRVTVQATADAIGNSNIVENKGEQYYTTLNILARTMDITLLKPGKTIGFRGYNSFIDNMVLQITSVDYSARRAGLQVGTLPRRFNSDVEQVVRGLIAEQTVNNPSTPT